MLNCTGTINTTDLYREKKPTLFLIIPTSTRLYERNNERSRTCACGVMYKRSPEVCQEGRLRVSGSIVHRV